MPENTGTSISTTPHALLTYDKLLHHHLEDVWKVFNPGVKQPRREADSSSYDVQVTLGTIFVLQLLAWCPINRGYDIIFVITVLKRVRD
jgi:hypothetical protein